MGRILAPTQDLKINLPGDITIPTLISPAGNSEDYVFLPNEDIYLETEVYLNSYNTLSPILGVQSTEYNIVNEYAFFISDINETGGRGIPQGAVVVYNGERGVSLSCYYTYQNIVNLNQWTKIVAKRVNSNWSIFINDVQCAVSRVTDSNVPNDIFGNINLPVHIGRLEVDDVNLDGQIRNVILNNKPKKNNKVSIKKQNLGGGKLLARKNTISAPSGIPLSTTNINITYNGTVYPAGNGTRTLVKQNDAFWSNERYGPNDPGNCETTRFRLKYQNARWEFITYYNYIDDGCNQGDDEFVQSNSASNTSIPTSGWAGITITAA